MFQSTRPVRGATLQRSHLLLGCGVSIHAPRAGRDRCSPLRRLSALRFNPRAPCGARPLPDVVVIHGKMFQSTRPVRGATGGLSTQLMSVDVSIHAPRAGRDARICQTHAEQVVSIHAPRAGRDHRHQGACNRSAVSIHAPRAGRDLSRQRTDWQRSVSIHAPRAGRDRSVRCARRRMAVFQSTRPVRGATALVGHMSPCDDVSIHAPRAGRDTFYRSKRFTTLSFQSTRPVRGATLTLLDTASFLTCFNPRAPCGARPDTTARRCQEQRFNPRAPCGARQFARDLCLSLIRFNPRAPCGARP